MEEYDFDGKLDFDGMEEYDFDGKLDFDGIDENQEGDGFKPIADSDDSQKPDSDGNTDDINEEPNSFEQEKESYENLNSEATSTVLISDNREEGRENLQNDDQDHENIEKINQEELNKEIEKELEEGVEAINKYLEQEAEFINAYEEILGAYNAEKLYESMKEEESNKNEEISEKDEELDNEKEVKQGEEVSESQLNEDISGEETSEQDVLEEELEERLEEVEQHQVEPLIEETLETEPEPIVNEEEIERLQEMELKEQFENVYLNEQIQDIIEGQEEEIEQEHEEKVEVQTDKEINYDLEEELGLDLVEQHQAESFIKEAVETEQVHEHNKEELDQLQELEVEEQFETVRNNEYTEELVESLEELEEHKDENDNSVQENEEVEQHQERKESNYLQEKLDEQEWNLEFDYEEKEEVEQHQVETAIEEELETEPKPIVEEEKLEHIKNLEPAKQLEAELFYELIDELREKQREEKEEHEELSTEEKVAQIKRELGINQEIKSGDAKVENRQEEVLEHETISPDVSGPSKKTEQEVLNEIDSGEEDSDKPAEINYEKLKKLYRQQTGKRPIYANLETKGFKQWLEQKKESEKKEKTKQEQDLKEVQKNEETWKRTLKNRIEEAREIEPELKSKLIKLVEKYNELEKLIKKYSQLHNKAQRKELSQTERNALNSLVEELLKLDPIKMELFLCLQEIKRYIDKDDYYYYEYWNNQHHHKVFSHFFTQLSRRYNTIKEIQKAKIIEELLENWIEQAFEAEINLELIAVLNKLVINYDELEELTTNFMKLYEKAKKENLIKSEQIEFNSLIKTLQKLDPLIIELFTNVRAIKHYLYDQNHNELLNKTHINRVLNIYLKNISQKYKNLKQQVLKLKENNENKTDENLSNNYKHFISLLSSSNTRQKAIKAWQKWSLQYNPSTISKGMKDRVKTTISFIKALKSEIQKIIPQSSLRKKNGILKLSDRKLSLLLGSIDFFINKTIRKAHEKHYFKIALDVLLTWKINLNSNSEIIGSPENAIALIDAYINLHKPVIPISRNQDMQLYRFHRFIDEDYFKIIDTIEKAYWLGFFFADGTITELHGKRNFISFTLKSTDALQVIRFCGSLGLNPNYIKTRTTRRLYKGEWRNYKAIGIGFTSSKIAKALYNLGFKGSKSKKTGWPLREFGNPLLDLVFLLGFYDGEGKEGRTDMKVGNKKILEQIKEKFGIPYEIGYSDGQFRLSLGSQLMNLMQSIFQKSLPRKRKIFKVWTHINPESNLLTFMTPRLLQALINKMSPERLSRILKLDDPILIYNLIKKWNLKMFSHK